MLRPDGFDGGLDEMGFDGSSEKVSVFSLLEVSKVALQLQEIEVGAFDDGRHELGDGIGLSEPVSDFIEGGEGPLNVETLFVSEVMVERWGFDSAELKDLRDGDGLIASLREEHGGGVDQALATLSGWRTSNLPHTAYNEGLSAKVPEIV